MVEIGGFEVVGQEVLGIDLRLQELKPRARACSGP